MTRPRPFERRLEAWLDEGPAAAPADLLDETLGAIDVDRPTRRRVGAGRGFLGHRSPIRFLAALVATAAAVLVIGLVGDAVLRSRLPGVGTEPSASAAASASLPVSTGPCQLAARVTEWQGAAGHRIAAVSLANTGSGACRTASAFQPRLVAGNGVVLVDGAPPEGATALDLAAGQSVTTLVDVANYCGAASPVAPVTVGFVLPDGSRLVATPVSATDTEGVPPCNGAPGSAGVITMHPWAP